MNFKSGYLVLTECENIQKSTSLFIAIISIPDSFKLPEILMKFEDFMEFISKIIVLKTEIAHFYSLVLKFKSLTQRNLFVGAYNGKNIEILDSEKFHLKIVKKFSFTDHPNIYCTIENLFSIHLNKQKEIQKCNKECAICL